MQEAEGVLTLWAYLMALGPKAWGVGQSHRRPALARGKLWRQTDGRAELIAGDWALLGRSSPASTSPRRISTEK